MALDAGASKAMHVIAYYCNKSGKEEFHTAGVLDFIGYSKSDLLELEQKKYITMQVDSIGTKVTVDHEKLQFYNSVKQIGKQIQTYYEKTKKSSFYADEALGPGNYRAELLDLAENVFISLEEDSNGIKIIMDEEYLFADSLDDVEKKILRYYEQTGKREFYAAEALGPGEFSMELHVLEEDGILEYEEEENGCKIIMLDAN